MVIPLKCPKPQPDTQQTLQHSSHSMVRLAVQCRRKALDLHLRTHFPVLEATRACRQVLAASGVAGMQVLVRTPLGATGMAATKARSRGATMPLNGMEYDGHGLDQRH